ncbi:hypothetical protein QAD02_011277 [Eretmocerus hayati]|uniref:Uncharacterized protein n=1 Tax=Eretmocerus hayati TaxID=131215 RepID=A0ACC2NY15_9HYME|nr:hypothetical protein QAD02_011277 [Eretmocerus hayati]
MLLNGISNVEKDIRDAARLVNNVVSQVQSAASSVTLSIKGNVNLTYKIRKSLVSSTLTKITHDIEQSQNLTGKAVDILNKEVLNRISKLLFIVQLANDSSSSRIEDLIDAQNKIIADATPCFKIFFISLGGDEEVMEQAQELKKNHESNLNEMLVVTKALADYLESVQERWKETKAECEAELTTLGFTGGKARNAITYFESTIALESEFTASEKDMIEVSDNFVKTMQQLRTELDKAYGDFSPLRYTRSITDQSRPRIDSSVSDDNNNDTDVTALVTVKSQDSCCSIFLADISGVLSYECEHPREDSVTWDG